MYPTLAQKLLKFYFAKLISLPISGTLICIRLDICDSQHNGFNVYYSLQLENAIIRRTPVQFHIQDTLIFILNMNTCCTCIPHNDDVPVSV